MDDCPGGFYVAGLGWELVTKAKRERAERGISWVGGEFGVCGFSRVWSGGRGSEKHEAALCSTRTEQTGSSSCLHGQRGKG